VIFKSKPDDLSWWAASRDFSLVALAFAEKPDRPAYVAIVKTDGTGYRELVRNDEEGKKQGLGLTGLATSAGRGTTGICCFPSCRILAAAPSGASRPPSGGLRL